ncbi:MAG TPA: three-Cys-motif partner protein TcmP [bacterium]|nr:three-Cys-motif partner protein TcmP [bacterium]
MVNESFEIPALIDDGLLTPEVKPHSLEKYRAISYFLKIFSASMKDKWSNRVYIDFFSGAGRSKIEGLNQIVPGSPLLALGIENKFDKYIFCEKEPLLCKVLYERVAGLCNPENFKIIPGDVNQNKELILKEIPPFKKGNTCLSFCLVDPFRLNDIKFQTIKYLADKLLVDFLILIPSNMDANRNESIYVDPDEDAVDDFLGDKDWRLEWVNKKGKMKFGLFVLECFCKKMKKLKYVYKGPEDTMRVMLKEKNFALYHLMLFSRNPLGYQFWENTKRGINPQMGFDFKEKTNG